MTTLCPLSDRSLTRRWVEAKKSVFAIPVFPIQTSALHHSTIQRHLDILLSLGLHGQLMLHLICSNRIKIDILRAIMGHRKLLAMDKPNAHVIRLAVVTTTIGE